MELLIDKGYVSIWNDPRGVIMSVWKGYFTNAKLKEGCSLYLHFTNEIKCKYILSDTRLAKGSFAQSMPWIQEYFLPRLIESGIQKIAFLVSPDPFTQRSIERVLEVNDQYEAQFFDEVEIAEKWLLDGFEDHSPLSLPVNKLTLKSNGEKILLDYPEIMYLYAHEKGTAVSSSAGIFYSKLSLAVMLKQLPDYFIQIHRSYIVNSNLISSIKYHNSGSYHLFLKTLPGIKIPVSKNRVPTLKKVLSF